MQAHTCIDQRKGRRTVCVRPWSKHEVRRMHTPRYQPRTGIPMPSVFCLHLPKFRLASAHNGNTKTIKIPAALCSLTEIQRKTTLCIRACCASSSVAIKTRLPPQLLQFADDLRVSSSLLLWYLALPLLHLPVVQVGHAVPAREERLGVGPFQTPQPLPALSAGDRVGCLVLPVGERDDLGRIRGQRKRGRSRRERDEDNEHNSSM